MLSNEQYWEIQHRFEKIHKLCILKCFGYAKEQTEYVSLFENIVVCCRKLLIKAEKIHRIEKQKEKDVRVSANVAYFQGMSYQQVREKEQENQNFQDKQKKVCRYLNKICFESGQPFRGDEYGIDYPLYLKRFKFGEWKFGENPYKQLQELNAFGQIALHELGLEDILSLFRNIEDCLTQEDDHYNLISHLDIFLKEIESFELE